MTTEQFRDLRTALRALRRVKRWEWPIPVDAFEINMASEGIEDVIYRGKRALPEYEAMMKAKSKVREAQRGVQRLDAERRAVNFVVNFALPTWAEQCEWIHATQKLMDARTEYHAARAAFVERIGGEMKEEGQGC